MTTPTATRVFTPARKEQGFADQAHLDRFYAYVDHKDGCGECGRPAPGMYLGDGSYQPAEALCPQGRRLLDRGCAPAPPACPLHSECELYLPIAACEFRNGELDYADAEGGADGPATVGGCDSWAANH